MAQNPMKNQASSQPDPQAGSVIILIFIAIALFVAVSFAISKGFRGGGGNITQETAKVAASEILAYGQSVHDGFRAMRVNGVPLEKIDYKTETMTKQDGSAASQTNTACTDDTCRLFKPTGGGVSERFFYEYAYTPTWWGATSTHVGGLEFSAYDIKDIGTSASEVVMKVLRVRPDICTAVNRLMGISGGPYTQDSETGKSQYILEGSNVAEELAKTDAYTLGYDQPALAGKNSFCVGEAEGGDVYVVLNAR